MEEVRHARFIAIGCQGPGQADDIVDLSGFCGRNTQEVAAVPAAEIEKPCHQLIAHLLGIGGVVNRANLNPAFPDAPGQLGGVRLAVAPQETGERFAGFDHVTELAVVVPAICLRAEFQRSLDVGVTDFRAQPVRIIAEAQIVMGIGDAKISSTSFAAAT